MTYSILIVEDDPMVASINQRYVKKVPGFFVPDIALTMNEAIALTNRNAYDLLLVDIHLANNSGLELIKFLRKKEYPADFIMITAKKEQEAITLSAQYGAIDYILKPFQFDRFKKSLLAFKYQKEVLLSQANLNQEDIDAFYWTAKSAVGKGNTILEKGLTQQTLQNILTAIDSFREPFTIEDLTKKTALSHVSVRKYVRFLEEQGTLKAQQKYGTIGRPTMHYTKP